MSIKLYEFQKEAIQKFFSKGTGGRLILALPTGTGKTIVALSIIQKVLERNPDAKILIVVPANLRNNFLQNIRKFPQAFNKLRLTIVKDINILVESYKLYSGIIISYNFLRRYINKIENLHFDMLVADEIHYAKNQSTQNFKALWKLTGSVKYFLALTASYISNSLEELFNIVSLVANDPTIYTTGKKLIKYEIKGSYNPNVISKLILKQKEVKGKKVQVGITDPVLFRQLVFKHIYIPKKEKIIQIGKRPKPISKVINVPLSEAEWKVYQYVIKKIPKEYLALLQLGEITYSQLKEIKNQIVAAQQVLITPDYIHKQTKVKRPSSKVKACAKYIHQKKVKSIVFTPFFESGAKVVYDYFKSIGINCALYTGKLKFDERRKLEHEFNHGSLQTLIMTTAGKEGINLPAAKEIHFLNLTWNPEDLEQIIGRALRITSKHDTVFVYWWFANSPDGQETIDHWMSNVLERKRILKKVVYDILSEMVTASISGYYEKPLKKVIRKFYPKNTNHIE